MSLADAWTSGARSALWQAGCIASTPACCRPEALAVKYHSECGHRVGHAG